MNQKIFTFYHSKNYGSLARVTRIIVAVNMADPTCLMEGAHTLRKVSLGLGHMIFNMYSFYLSIDQLFLNLIIFFSLFWIALSI